MKFLILCLLLSLILVNGYSQGIKTSRVRILLADADPEALLQSGLDLSHGFYEKGLYFESDFSSHEISILEDTGILYEVLIDDVTQYYVERSTNPDFVDQFAQIRSRSDDECDFYRTRIIGDQPQNFQLGSMIGFHRYYEILYHLDKMSEMYPDLISSKVPVGNFRTFKGKPIYQLIISNPSHQTQTPKPKILYTSLHHAREPISVSQLLYFMWYVLENYEKDDLIKSIVDNYELYFLPIVNPDGYIYNEEIAPNGGGSHRKNIKSYNLFDTGVDLNRNYPYNFGLNNTGSSNNHSYPDYRGPFAASESEVRAIVHLCEIVPFDIALNYHSYGNVLLYPWGFTTQEVDDVRIFREFGQEMLRDNSMYAGLVSDNKTIGYFTNGASDDWMYGEQETKNKILAFSPEVGDNDDGFWPQISRIVPLCKEMLHTNIVSAAMLGNYAILSDDGPDYIHDIEYSYPFNIKRMGLRGGTFKVSVKAISANIMDVGPQQTYELELFESEIGEIGLNLHNEVPDYEEIRFVVELDNGLYIHRDTITKLFMSNKVEVFSDEAMDMDNWDQDNSGRWHLNDESVFSQPFSFSNTNASSYRERENSSMTLKEPIDLRNAQVAYLTFRTKYVIEPDHDKAIISASSTGFQFQPLCGKRSIPSEHDNNPNTPVYEGFQYNWLLETIDLKDFLGSQVYLRIEFHSDETHEYDGFSFDDMKVVVVEDPLLNTDEDSISSTDFAIFPNPSSGQLYYRLQNIYAENQSYKLKLYNIVGQLVHSEQVQSGSDQRRLLNPKLSPGVYTYQLLGNQSILGSGKFFMQ